MKKKTMTTKSKRHTHTHKGAREKKETKTRKRKQKQKQHRKINVWAESMANDRTIWNNVAQQRPWRQEQKRRNENRNKNQRTNVAATKALCYPSELPGRPYAFGVCPNEPAKCQYVVSVVCVAVADSIPPQCSVRHFQSGTQRRERTEICRI